MQDRQIKLDESQVNSALCSVTQQYYFCLKKWQLLLALDLPMWQDRGVVLERQKKGCFYQCTRIFWHKHIKYPWLLVSGES